MTEKGQNQKTSMNEEAVSVCSFKIVILHGLKF